jgi:hypothetical protein
MQLLCEGVVATGGNVVSTGHRRALGVTARSPSSNIPPAVLATTSAPSTDSVTNGEHNNSILRLFTDIL